MKGYNKKLCSLAFTSIIFVAVFSSGCIDTRFNSDEERLTAKTAFQLAFEDANESMEGKLTVEEAWLGRMVGEGVNNDGYAKRWRCSFSIPKNHTHRIYFRYAVDGDESIELRNRETSQINNGNPIENWIIDSDEAVEVGKSNQKIERYLNKYDRASIEGMRLYMRDEYSKNDWIWMIHWSYSGGIFGDPVHAEIIINARNGEVIEVDADE